MIQAIRSLLLTGIIAFLVFTYTTRAFGAPPIDLAVSLSATPDPVITGSNLTYSILITYFDRTPAKDVVLTDTLPAGSTFVSVYTTRGICSSANGSVVCSIGDMSNNSSSVTVTIVVTSPLISGAMLNSVSVSSTTDDPDVTNNVATQLTTVNLPTLSVIVTGDGTVQSSSDTTGVPDDINCFASVCAAGYPLGSIVNLTATPSWYSTVQWGGCAVTGSLTCSVLVNADVSVNAYFVPNNNVRLNYALPLHSRIMDAYAAIGTSGSGHIQAQEFSFLESPVFDRPVTVVLDGGMDASFGSVIGCSTIGPVRVSQGRITFRNIVIK